MATRIEAEVYDRLKIEIPELKYYPIARICALSTSESSIKYPGSIAILTAGTADLPVAEEAAITAQLCGFQVQRLWDVGVAGIHRLLSHRTILDRADVLIVVAGMEGALPSVVAGMAGCPVIAVPTSIGYGANFSGVAPLLTMLNSCAAGIGVVNIDNGFGAAILAGQILRTAKKLAVPLVDRKSLPTISSAWQLAYTHDENGMRTAGDINTLIDAVRQGRQVRLLLSLLDRYEYITEAQNLWLKDGIVYAQNTTQVSVDFKDDLLSFTEDACHTMIVVSTQGDLDVTRWLLGKHKEKGHTSHKTAISWFIN
jgi:phosphoribosylcarboxyaminoimidazole (NCAIR) mutase